MVGRASAPATLMVGRAHPTPKFVLVAQAFQPVLFGAQSAPYMIFPFPPYSFKSTTVTPGLASAWRSFTA